MQIRPYDRNSVHDISLTATTDSIACAAFAIFELIKLLHVFTSKIFLLIDPCIGNNVRERSVCLMCGRVCVLSVTDRRVCRVLA